MDEAVTELRDAKLFGAVALYGPHTVCGLKIGEKKHWCACGLSKNQPWCDGSHKGTGFKPLLWVVGKQQSVFQICTCKYTQTPPICDATHTHLPCVVKERQASCQQKHAHCEAMKLCTSCGWVPDF